MYAETIAPGLQPGATNEPAKEIIHEPSMPGLSAPDEVRLALLNLAQSEPDELTEDLALQGIGKTYRVKMKVLNAIYPGIKSSHQADKRAERELPLTQDELAAQRRVEEAARKEQEDVDGKVQQLMQVPDLVPVFHQALGSIGYICDELLAASVFLSHGARLLKESSAFFFYGASGSGKTVVVVKGSRFLPPGVVLSLTSVSEQALHYLGDIKGKYIIFGEISPRVDEQDDPRQMAMRQLISENKITRMIVEKPDGKSMIGVMKVTEGPCVVIATTTKEPNKFNDELQNRASWVTSNDSDEVTEAVKASIAERAENPVRRADRQIELLIKAFQQFHASLEALPVKIPFARKITPTSKHVTVRRLTQLILNYITISALLHQHCREKEEVNGQRVIVATWADYRLAYRVLTANAPRVLESCAPRAREAFDTKLKPAMEAVKAQAGFANFKTAQIQLLLGEPPSTVRRWLNDYVQAGLLYCASDNSRQNVYQLTEVGDAFTQDLGLISPDNPAEPDYFDSLK